jgi:hypothetical protein
MTIRNSVLLAWALFLLSTTSHAVPWRILDLATTPVEEGRLSRVSGSVGRGDQGLPVAGGFDVDGDGFRDLLVGFFKADPLGREDAGEVNLVFGDGTLGDMVDTATDDPRLLRFVGAGRKETAGSEVWMDDVTGDGLGDLLICRQNFTLGGERIGAGALTIVPGSAALRTRAANFETVDLAAPGEVTVTTLVGAKALDRLCIWVRTGDVDGDGIADILVGADQEDLPGETNRGAAYVVRGGAHLGAGGVIDLADLGETVLVGHIARLTPPPGSMRHHFGATCQIGDLDGNGRGEVLVAATIARSGAAIEADGAPAGTAEANAGAPDGAIYIVWDENFPLGLWPAGFTLDLAALPGDLTVIHGEAANRNFGEEILAGLDYDGDGAADLFVGDLLSDDPEGRISIPGIGYVFFGAADLRGLDLDLDEPPPALVVSRIVGPSTGSLGADTAAHGDFDGDGLADLAFGSPHASPQGRASAGIVHVFFGQLGGWPAQMNTAPGELLDPSVVRIAVIRGAAGARNGDLGDTLAYSGTAADFDDDGQMDLIINEMVGNGVAPGTVDVGNLLVLGGSAFAGVNTNGCSPAPTAPCVQQGRFQAEVSWRNFDGATGVGTSVSSDAEDSALFWFFQAENWELLVKVIDGCSNNGHFWVFAAATTNVEYTLRVTDTLTGVFQEYVNPLGTASAAITDTAALATCPSPAVLPNAVPPGAVPPDVVLLGGVLSGGVLPKSMETP